MDPQTIGMSSGARWAFVARRWLRRFKLAKRETPFLNIMDMAHDVADRNPAALHDLVKLLLRPMQSSAIVAVVDNTAHQSPASIDCKNFFFDDGRVRSVDEGCELELPKDPFRVRFATDVVLPWRPGTGNESQTHWRGLVPARIAANGRGISATTI